MGQIKALNTYDRETKYNEKVKTRLITFQIDILKHEIKSIKDSLKENVENYLKQEKYIKHIHENIAWVEKKIKNLTAPKIDTKKSFSKEDLKNVLENLNLLKNIINENKAKLNNTIKQKEQKLKNYANINKKIELDFKENDKVKIF